ncbi:MULTISPECIES: MbtH family protein [Bacillus]|uniref:Protein mbtH n=1 Tax=Bacillus zhangzhouensis TaxID=1178540 RepID=A0A081L8B4_9BACI|nr:MULTISPECIES: MbtH family protein [Bacillus]KEP25490.1 protein mbtH [Bacillus zhangzhouensis]MDR0124233.1 MbtH family protein [Bacillus zhangzhouensis]PRO39784.1 MbtH family protein [Bacillus sp. LLTC93]
MNNPFLREDGSFLVLMNETRQHSLWPSFEPVPKGWETVYGEDTRDACIDYIQANWQDLRCYDVTEEEAQPSESYKIIVTL